MPKETSFCLILDLDEYISNIKKCWCISEKLFDKYKINPIIISSSLSLHLTVQGGFLSEYFPCYSSNGFKYSSWNRWLELRVLELCATYGVGCVIYVGDRPPAGLLSAIDGLFRTASFWVKGDEAKPGSATSDLAIHFDLVFEESTTPVLLHKKLPRKGFAIPVPPVFSSGPVGKDRSGIRAPQSANGGQAKAVLVQISTKYTLSSKLVHELVGALQRQDPKFEMHLQTVDPESLTFLAQVNPGPEKFLPTREMVRKFHLIIMETSDAEIISEILSAKVPAILMQRDPQQRDKIAEFVLREKVALVHDPASGQLPKKMNALFRRIESVRKRLAKLALANGTDVICEEIEKFCVIANTP